MAEKIKNFTCVFGITPEPDAVSKCWVNWEKEANKALLWIVDTDPHGSGTIIPDPDPAKSERA